MKDFGKKIIRLIDGLIDKSILLICIVFVSAWLIWIYDSYMVYQQATDNSILKYKLDMKPMMRQIKKSPEIWWHG